MNGRNSSFSCSLLMPLPESSTVMEIFPFCSSRSILIEICPFWGVYFTAFDTMLNTIVSTLAWSKVSRYSLAKGVKVMSISLRLLIAHRSWYILRMKPMISLFSTARRETPTDSFRNSINSFTRRSMRFVPRFADFIAAFWVV